MVHASSSTDLSEPSMPESPTSTDGWGDTDHGIITNGEQEGDKDGWDDIEPLEDPKPSPSLANIQAAQRRPVSLPVSQKKPSGY